MNSIPVYQWIESFARMYPQATNEQIAQAVKFWRKCSIKEAREYVTAWVIK